MSLLATLIVGLAVVRSASPASAAPVLTATPNPVVIPAGETAGVFDLTWDSGTGQDVELVLQRSGKPPDPPLLVASAGTMKDIAIAVAEVVTVTMQEPGGVRPLTRPLTVTGVQGEQPSVPDRVRLRDRRAPTRHVGDDHDLLRLDRRGVRRRARQGQLTGRYGRLPAAAICRSGRRGVERAHRGHGV